MCATVFVNPGTPRVVVCETQAQLKEALRKPLIYLPDAPPGAYGDDRGCLCWVDVERIANGAGYSSTFDGVDYAVTT